MWRTPKSNPTLRMTDLPWAPSLRASCAFEHAGVSAASAAGGGSVTSTDNRRTARELPSRRLAIDLEAAAPVTAGEPGGGGSTRPATGSSNLRETHTSPSAARQRGIVAEQQWRFTADWFARIEHGRWDVLVGSGDAGSGAVGISLAVGPDRREPRPSAATRNVPSAITRRCVHRS